MQLLDLSGPESPEPFYGLEQRHLGATFYIPCTNMARPSSRLDPGSVVLVTGANGYIASTVVDILLKQGFNVRGTVRSFKPWLQKMFDEKYGYGRFETVVLPDLRLQEDLEVVLEGAQGLIHVVSPERC